MCCVGVQTWWGRETVACAVPLGLDLLDWQHHLLRLRRVYGYPLSHLQYQVNFIGGRVADN